MNKYKVAITEVVCFVYEVEADNTNEAIDMADLEHFTTIETQGTYESLDIQDSHSEVVA